MVVRDLVVGGGANGANGANGGSCYYTFISWRFSPAERAVDWKMSFLPQGTRHNLVGGGSGGPSLTPLVSCRINGDDGGGGLASMAGAAATGGVLAARAESASSTQSASMDLNSTYMPTPDDTIRSTVSPAAYTAWALRSSDQRRDCLSASSKLRGSV